MKVAVIINPVAGPARVRGRVSSAGFVSKLLEKHGVDGDVVLTEGPGHATELARHFVEQGCSPIVAWGGDGTVNEVGAALLDSSAALGIIPRGSGNGLARDLGIAADPADALRTALSGRERVIDAGEVGGRVFFNVAGLGFDAHLAHLFNAGMRRGFSRYLLLTVREVVSYRPVLYSIAWDTGTVRERALLVVVANSRQYGAGAIIAPAARLDDGKLQLVVVRARSVWTTLWNIPRLFKGTVDKAHGVLMQPIERVTITGDGPIRFHVDGEDVLGPTQVTARVLPGAIRVRVNYD